MGGVMFNLNNLNGCELIALANILTITIAQELTSEEIGVLAGFFTVIGDGLALMAINNSNSENCK